MHEQVSYLCEESKKMIKRWIEWDKQRGGCGGKELLEDFETMILPSLSFTKSGIRLEILGEEEGLKLIRVINQTINDIYNLLYDYIQECEKEAKL